jgi:signal transduction histidine kinase/CheY-like chemotaxis protein
MSSRSTATAATAGRSDFLAGGGEMGERVRAFDWAATELGHTSGWPQSLKTTVRLLLSTGHPMFIWWGPKLIQFYNDAYRRSIGPERHPGALGQEGRQCWAEIWPIIGPQIEQVMSGGGHTWHENQLVPITRNGQCEDVYWTYSYGPIDDAAAPNGIGGVLVVCTETTQQVLAEKELESAEAGWRRLFEQAPGFMSILSGPSHRFEFANDRYFDLVGHRDVIGKTVLEALPEVESQGFIRLLDEVYVSGVPYFGRSSGVELVGANGEIEEHFIDFMYAPIREAEGDITGILVDGYDVTARVRADEQVRQQDKRKDEFLAMLAHELRNPLAPIRNAGELLLRSQDPGADAREVGEMISRQVTQLTRLVDDLLDVSRLTTGRIELKKEVFDLTEAVSAAVESVKPLAEEKSQTIRLVASDRPDVDADPARLVQSVANILTNAIKYTQDGGRIDVSVNREGPEAIVRVADNGVGIRQEMLPRVFELFVQDTRTLDRAEGGLGIGLAVVARLVQMHGGTVSVESPGLGEGATFQIRLPVASRPPAVTRRKADSRSHPRRILIVDDNEDSADSLATLLRLDGHDVEVCYTSLRAINSARNFDVVLLDIGLPELNGYDVASRLRAEGYKGLIVAITGYSQDEDIRQALHAGCDAHLAKPMAIGALQSIMNADCV